LHKWVLNIVIFHNLNSSGLISGEHFKSYANHFQISISRTRVFTPRVREITGALLERRSRRVVIPIVNVMQLGGFRPGVFGPGIIAANSPPFASSPARLPWASRRRFAQSPPVPQFCGLGRCRASACFVLVPEDDPGRIAGFYTLSAATITLAKLPTELTAQLPKYRNLPATLLGWMARDQRFRGVGLGDLLLVSALRRALDSTVRIGSMAMVTDPKNAQAEKFYQKHGFRSLGGGRRWVRAAGPAKPQRIAGIGSHPVESAGSD
jgi:GNAT superfamily N-acetyltransferase